MPFQDLNQRQNCYWFGALVRLVLGLVSFKGSRLLVQKGQLCILHAYCGGGGVGGEMGGKITFDLQDFA